MSEKSFRYFVLTGAPGSGKTTLVKKVCDVLRENKLNLNGFYTEEVRSGRERIGFDVVLLHGDRAPLARFNSGGCSNKPIVGKYVVDVSSFESSVLPVLKSHNKNSILVLDEIGKMELFSRQFRDIVQKCLESSQGIVLATVPLKSTKPIPIVEAIKNHPQTLLITVDKETRNELLDKLARDIMEAKRG